MDGVDAAESWRARPIPRTTEPRVDGAGAEPFRPHPSAATQRLQRKPAVPPAKGDRLHTDMVARIIKDHLTAVYHGTVDVEQYFAAQPECRVRHRSQRPARRRPYDGAAVTAQTARHQSLAMIRTYARPDNRLDNTALTGDWW